jgi:ppGpp synthetase/RelA/SpoT-type nucleotidyltranferase
MNDLHTTVSTDSTVSIYGDALPELEQTMQMLLGEIEQIRYEMTSELGMDPIEHLLGRIKTEESMREKCRRKGLPETAESALGQIRDAIGVRVVCAFIDDV